MTPSGSTVCANLASLPPPAAVGFLLSCLPSLDFILCSDLGLGYDPVPESPAYPPPSVVVLGWLKRSGLWIESMGVGKDGGVLSVALSALDEAEIIWDSIGAEFPP